MNTMIKTRNSFAVITFLLLAFVGFSQETKEEKKAKKEKIEQLRIEYFTEELDLSDAEADKFWPIFNEMEDKVRAEKKKRKTLSQELQDNFDALSDAEIKAKTNDVFDCDIRIIELKKSYTNEFAGLIGQKKATKLLSLDRKFKRELLKKMKEEN